MPSEIKLARCVCGASACLVQLNMDRYYVRCNGANWRNCWVAPWRKTRRGAALAWNRVMERKEAKRG